MRFSVFSVTDHHPELPRTIRQFYTELLDHLYARRRSFAHEVMPPFTKPGLLASSGTHEM